MKFFFLLKFYFEFDLEHRKCKNNHSKSRAVSICKLRPTNYMDSMFSTFETI